LRKVLPFLALNCLAAACFLGTAAANELDALKLEAEPEKSTKPASRGTRAFAELALGNATQRYGLGDESLRRLSLDLQLSAPLATGWRGVLSNRLDAVSPQAQGSDRTVNTLREAYVGWQDNTGQLAVEFGRINLRTGPGYGYNPSDFFRTGSQRTVTTVDPIALRDNRMGTVALRAQNTWSGGSLVVALAPKLASKASSAGFSLDLGATNDQARGQLVVSQKLSEGVSGQLVAFKQDGQAMALGASASALLGDALVAHAEWSTSRERRLADLAWMGAGAAVRAQRGVLGLTWSAPGATTLTLEYQANGFALSGAQWATAAASGGVPRLGSYLLTADQRVDLAARRAVLFYATKKNLAVKGLDLTALLRLNGDDHSRLAWIELRYLWASAELALQWQQLQGKSLSEFGVLPTRSSTQLVGTYRF
jgi:hypothetical protein